MRQDPTLFSYLLNAFTSAIHMLLFRVDAYQFDCYVPPVRNSPLTSALAVDIRQGFERWYNPLWLDEHNYLPTRPLDEDLLRKTVVNAVVKRMMADVPFGVLLSGKKQSSQSCLF